MGKILKFPDDRCIRKNLDASKEDLQELYEGIKTCYESIEQLEDILKNKEKEYDLLFAQYVNAVGVEHVEIEYIEFVSGDLSINVETGEISYERQEEGKEDQPEPPEPSSSA